MAGGASPSPPARRQATMRALHVNAAGTVSVDERDAEPLEGECLIRVLAAGVCGTDLHILSGYAGFEGVLGHEFVGIVEQVAVDGDPRWLGKRVAGELNVGCGRCSWCASGQKEHCPQRSVLGIKERPGAFAEYLSLPAANLHEIPPEIDDVSAVFVEPVAAACQILAQIPLEAGTRAAVLGDGRMGLIVAQVLAAAGARVTVLGKHERKLRTAADLGLRCEMANRLTRAADRYDLVVDVTGRPEGFTQALELVRPRGIVVLKSTFHGEVGLASWPIVVNEVTLVGSRCGPFAPAIEMMRAGSIQVTPLVSGELALEDFQGAFELARRELKVILRP